MTIINGSADVTSELDLQQQLNIVWWLYEELKYSVNVAIAEQMTETLVPQLKQEIMNRLNGQE